MALPFDERPIDETPVHTTDLPDTPQRERRIPGRAWVEAPPELHALGTGIGGGEAGYIRRIHGWLLWRSGPATKGDARYLAVAEDALAVQHGFRLFADGSGEGTGPSGTRHDRFRSWKEDLRDHARSPSGTSARQGAGGHPAASASNPSVNPSHS